MRVVVLCSCLHQDVARAAGDTPDGEVGLWAQERLIPEWGGLRNDLEELGIGFEVAYTGDFMSNVDGGLVSENVYLGNLDVTSTWHTEALLGRDFGTVFVYGLVNHGGSISAAVGDAQGVDNIEAPSTAKVFEVWWQKLLFDGRASLLVGLYDVNSEFYAVDTAEIFIQSSFGIGAELGTSGINGPSIFPTTSLGARFKAEIVPGLEVQAAVLDGVPGDPLSTDGTRIRFDAGDGVFLIAEIAHYRFEGEGEQGVLRSEQRRRVGRQWSQRTNFAKVAVGTWWYSTRMPHLSRTDAVGDPIQTQGHPGLYLIADFDASKLDLLDSRGFAIFVQLGMADGDVGQFAGYTGAGLKYTGLLPFRRDDDCGFAVAAAYNGSSFKDASRAQGDSPAVAEVALEWTYRAALTPWLSLQGELQYIVNPGGLQDRANALIAGFRYTVDF